MHARLPIANSPKSCEKPGPQKEPRPSTLRDLKSPIWSYPLQTSLKINVPGDSYEQEAERVAEQVMHMPKPQVQRTTCACGKPAGPGGMCADCKRKQPGIQRMAASDVSPTAAPPDVHQVLQQPGSPLDVSTRHFMEARFGQDFGQVRMHTDAKAAEAAATVNAQAFTVGQDVVFGAGYYQPGAPIGKRLLAHELAHVVQQGHSGALTMQRTPDAPGRRQATIRVRWVEDDRAFYHRVINAINLSEGFRGVSKASLWQPFHDPVFRFFHRFSRQTVRPTPGATVTLRAEIWFDPTVFHGQVSNAYLDAEEVARLKEVTITGELTPRQTFPDRGATEWGPDTVVDLSFSSKPSIMAAEVGGLKWHLDAGEGTLTGGDDGKGTFTATTPGAIRLELRVVSGLAAGRTVSTHTARVLGVKGMVAPDAERPERLIIKRDGLTAELLAEHLYGDKTKATAIWAVWDATARGEPWTTKARIPAGMWIRFEYRHLKPEFKKVFDASLDIKTRAEWGAKPPIIGNPDREYEPYTVPLEDVLDSIVVHHAGNKGYKTMREVQDVHLDEREAADINYHYGIDLGGQVYEGRSINVKGAHVAGANTGKIGIVLLADLDPENKGLRAWEFDRSEDPLSPEMEASLLKLIHFLVGKYPNVKFLGGHQEFDTRRFCPGKKAMDKMSGWRSETNLREPP